MESSEKQKKNRKVRKMKKKMEKIEEFEIPNMSPFDLNEFGVLAHELDNDEEALKCFNKAIELDPNYAHSWHNKGFTLYILGKFQEALKCINKAIELDTNFIYAWNVKGLCLKGLGKNQEALKCFNKAIELDPTYDRALLNKEELERRIETLHQIKLRKKEKQTN